jgi:uncharacterized protein YdcH (DUF465 family)
MHEKFQPIVDALASLAETVKASTTETRSAQEISNAWNFPALDKHDLMNRANMLASLVRARAPDEDTEESVDVAVVVSRIKLLQSQTVPYCFNGHGNVAIPAFMTTLDGMQAWMEASWPTRESLDPSSFPAKLARQARAAKSRLDSVLEGLDDLDHRLESIVAAHQAAEALPTDLEELKQLRLTLVALNGQSTADSQAIGEKRELVQKSLEAIQEDERTAQQLVSNCGEAYRITTTKGLASAFDQRANSLAVSVRIWVGGLVVALLAVALIGHNRVTALSALLESEPRWGAVLLNFLLSAISVGAPLWFAWVATKQIGQRFRLSEDYGFKASVAKAYEGYRREAVRIDPEFEAQLFGIALSRLDEEPLRLVETESHGSPWHEMLDAAQRVPGFKEKVTQLAKDALRKKDVASRGVTPESSPADSTPA